MSSVVERRVHRVLFLLDSIEDKARMRRRIAMVFKKFAERPTTKKSSRAKAATR
jgi:hypothetical protein